MAGAKVKSHDRRSALASGTIEGRSAAIDTAPDQAATRTCLAFPSIGPPAFREIAQLAVGSRIVPQARTACFDGSRQYGAHGFDQALAALLSDASSRRTRRDAREMERLADVDVAKTSHDALIEQQRLYRRLSTRNGAAEIAGCKYGPKRLRSESGKSRKQG